MFSVDLTIIYWLLIVTAAVIVKLGRILQVSVVAGCMTLSMFLRPLTLPLDWQRTSMLGMATYTSVTLSRACL